MSSSGNSWQMMSSKSAVRICGHSLVVDVNLLDSNHQQNYKNLFGLLALLGTFSIVGKMERGNKYYKFDNLAIYSGDWWRLLKYQISTLKFCGCGGQCRDLQNMHETHQEHRRNEDLWAKGMIYTQGGDVQLEQCNSRFMIVGVRCPLPSYFSCTTHGLHDMPVSGSGSLPGTSQ
jgi:hypothetical protein